MLNPFCRKARQQSMKNLMRKMRKKLILMTMILKVILYLPSLLFIVLAFYRLGDFIWQLELQCRNFIIRILLKCPFIDIMADDEEDMLEHYLAEKSDSSHSSRRAA